MLLTDNLCRGGGGRGDPSNNTPTGHRKMWKNMKSWFENFHENLVPLPICTSFRLMPLSLEACLKKMFPPKWKGKKKGGSMKAKKSRDHFWTPKQSIFPPVHTWTSEAICKNIRQCRAWLVNKVLGSFSLFGQMIRKWLDYMWPVWWCIILAKDFQGWRG